MNHRAVRLGSTPREGEREARGRWLRGAGQWPPPPRVNSHCRKRSPVSEGQTLSRQEGAGSTRVSLWVRQDGCWEQACHMANSHLASWVELGTWQVILMWNDTQQVLHLRSDSTLWGHGDSGSYLSPRHISKRLRIRWV